MADNKFLHDSGCKDAVCIDAGRVYDSCSDKDCLEDLRVYFTEREQMVIDRAVSVRPRNACVITTLIDIEPLPFNRGYFACDLTFFFNVEVEAITGRNCPPANLCGVCVFRKRVILFGSEGNVKIFSSEFREDRNDLQQPVSRNLPVCKVQVAEPIVLSACVVDPCDRKNCKCDCDCGCNSIPEGIANSYGGCFVDPEDSKAVYVTLGIFTIVQLIRNVQMLIPVYDFCIPTKDCSISAGDEPCDLFRKMVFPIDEFFPPEHKHHNDKGKCGCDRK
jgi:hypothetical protein